MGRVYYRLCGDGGKSGQEGVLGEGCWGFGLGCLAGWLAITLLVMGLRCGGGGGDGGLICPAAGWMDD